MDNADLQKLRVAPGKLVPKFRPDVLQYSITVASSVAEVKLTPLTSDAGASCTVKGDAAEGRTVKLVEGRTVVVEVVVTAEDGKTNKNYAISIRRLSADDACLSSLDVSSGTLRPSFSPNVHDYYCLLPCSSDSITLRTSTEDPAMKVTMKDGGAVGAATISAGHSLLEVAVSSVSGKNTAIYNLTTIRTRCPYELMLKDDSTKYKCGVCGGVAHCVCRVRGTSNITYCWRCVEEVTKISKTDPLTGAILGENWLMLDFDADKELSSLSAQCHTPYGVLEGPIAKLPSQLVAKHASKTEPQQQACSECSKKVPPALMETHKKLSCSSSLSGAPLKFEVKVAPWQKRLVNSTLSGDCQAVLKIAEQRKEKYISQLGQNGAPEGRPADTREQLMDIASCYATAISLSPSDSRGHVGLALILEELFYCEDMYGIEQESTEDAIEESAAELSSKEEEFQAICRLHGVPKTATLAQQLMAVDKEYHQLKESGQQHKAEHVQQLYAWKSKRALQAEKGAYSTSTEGPLTRAKEKLQHAVTVNVSDHSALFHLGRLSLLLGDTDTAKSCLVTAASIKPTDPDTLMCLGLALVSSSSPSALLLSHGLTHYLSEREKIAESPGSKPTSLHSANTWRPTNTLIGEAFLLLARHGGHGYLTAVHCLLQAARLFSDSPGIHKGSTHKQLLWILIRSRAALLEMSYQKKDSNASSLCQQLSAIISHCQLPGTTELCKLQMEVFQTGVQLQPTSCVALTHLGNGQLMQYDITADKQWLTNAELSFRASLSVEANGSAAGIPSHLQQQQWWQQATKQASNSSSTVPAASKQSAAAVKPNAGSKQPVKPASTTAARRGPGAATTAGKTSTAPSKPAAAAPTKPAAGRQSAAASKPAAGRQPAAASKPGAGRQPAPAVGNRAAPGGRGRGQPTPPRSQPGGKGVATLGDLKAGTKSTEAIKQPPAETKQQPKPAAESSPASQPAPESSKSLPSIPTYHPRLGLARVLNHQADGKPSEECISLYREVIKISPDVHDAYIELGDLLKRTDPIAAVEVYSSFPFSNPPSFDDAYLHGEIVQLLMTSESYDNPRLPVSMIAMGRALGLAVLEKNVSILEAKFKSPLLKQVYAGVHNKDIDNPELQAFFKFKCWN